MRRLLLALLAPAALLGVLAGAPAPASAATCAIDLDRKIEPGMLDAQGYEFLEELKKCNPDLADVLVSAVEHDNAERYAKMIARREKFILGAYSVLWTILMLGVVGTFLRQRRLKAQIVELETRLAEKPR